MKKIMKKTLAVVLALVMISSTFVCCFAADLNQEAVDLHRGQYKKYLLLGDSVASGYRDQVTENDELFNDAYQESTYYRVAGSYGDVLTKAIIEDDTMISFAGPGFRTIEVRYMLEDDFDECDDYMFHPSHLYVVGDPGSQEIRAAYKKAVAEADLITLGVGGNDWGAYLGWVVNDIFEEEHVPAEYKAKLVEVLENSNMDLGTIEKIVEVADMAGMVPVLLERVPAALKYGLGGFYKNWDIMIQDIYDLNPDVTLMVVGMSDNSVKGKYYDYDGVVGAPVNGEVTEEDASKAQLMSVIIGVIMGIGNKPMIDGAKKFGYTYVDTTGTTYVDSHPDAAGHVHIANKIIEALPDPEISKMFTDVTPGHKNYKEVEYVIANGIMSGTSEKTFSPDAALTKGQLAAAMNAINGGNAATDNTDEVGLIEFASTVFINSIRKGLVGLVKGIIYLYTTLNDNIYDLGRTVTRAEAAGVLKDLNEY